MLKAKIAFFYKYVFVSLHNDKYNVLQIFRNDKKLIKKSD